MRGKWRFVLYTRASCSLLSLYSSLLYSAILSLATPGTVTRWRFALSLPHSVALYSLYSSPGSSYAKHAHIAHVLQLSGSGSLSSPAFAYRADDNRHARCLVHERDERRLDLAVDRYDDRTRQCTEVLALAPPESILVLTWSSCLRPSSYRQRDAATPSMAMTTASTRSEYASILPSTSSRRGRRNSGVSSARPAAAPSRGGAVSAFFFSRVFTHILKRSDGIAHCSEQLLNHPPSNYYVLFTLYISTTACSYVVETPDFVHS